MEKTKKQIEIESILNSLPNLTNHPNWGWHSTKIYQLRSL
jgi:hypothetical protein